MAGKLKRHSISKIYYGEWFFKTQRIRRSSGTRLKVRAEVWFRKQDDELYNFFKLGEVTHRWEDAVIGYMRNREDKASYERDKRRLKWFHQFLGGKRIQDVNTDLLTEVRDIRLESVKASTVNREMNLISAILHYAEEREWIVKAPKIPKGEVPEPFPEYLTPMEVSKLISALATPHNKHLLAFTAFAIATGMRLRNITHLEWSQVDFERRVALIRPDASKNRKPLAIPLAEDAIAVLRAQVGNHPDRVFTYNGNPYNQPGIRALNQAAKRAGLSKHIHPHLFRHTFASWHIMTGTSLYELMQLGGWRKMESVMIYAHLSTGHMAATAANRKSIEGVFSKALLALEV